MNVISAIVFRGRVDRVLDGIESKRKMCDRAREKSYEQR